MEKGRVLIGLCFSLLGYIFLLEGIWQIIIPIIIGALALLAILILTRDKFPPKIKHQLDDISDNLNVGWLALALGLFGAGVKFIQNPIKSEPLVWLGLVFVLFAAYFIGNSIGIGANQMVKSNAKVCIAIGIVIFIGGIFQLIYTWNSIIEKPLTNITYPILIFGLSFIFIYFGFRRWQRIGAVKVKSIKTPS